MAIPRHPTRFSVDGCLHRLPRPACARTHRGQARVRRRLTQQGDPQRRRLLYLAAMTARRSPAWAGFYQRDLDRGLKRTQTLTLLARKLAYIAFAILKNGTDYGPRKPWLAT